MKKDEKDLSLDEFRDKVYKNVGTLEALNEDRIREDLREKQKKGCFGILILPFLSPFLLKMGNKAISELKIKELSVDADNLLANAEIKKSLCSKLGATAVLPIDVAYKITPVLYKMAQKSEIQMNSMLFAVISKKIADRGVENYCAVDAE